MGTIVFIAVCLVVFLGVGIGRFWSGDGVRPPVHLTPPAAHADDNGGEC